MAANRKSLGITPRLRRFPSFVAVTEPSCRDVLAVIQCYVDGECDLRTMMAIASHLDHCCACTEELQMLRWLKAAVRRCVRAPESPLWL
jgi:anti-sigma factor (TIGR02949 family)